MARTPPPTSSKDDRLREAVRLAERGEVELARAAFEAAIALDRRNVDLVYNLALLEETAGNIDRAAHMHTRVLADKPAHPTAARALARLVTRFEVNEVKGLVPAGLKAALNTDGLARQPLVDVTLRSLMAIDAALDGATAELTADAASERAAGLALLRPRVVPALANELLHACLRQGVVRLPSLERLLTGVRAAFLLDSKMDCFDNRTITDLALALVAQGWNNDHAWAETTDEAEALAAITIDRAALLSGDRVAVRSFMLKALYRPLDDIMSPHLSLDEARRLKPRALRDAIEPQVSARMRQGALAPAFPTLAPLADATSLRVAGQYEAAPYPRWTSLQVSQAGSLKRSLATFTGAERVAFMDGRFDVLVAGCGTGQQILQSATAYGPNAQLVGMDLSRASLGYAADMAIRHQVTNVEFIQGDILDAARLAQSFDIIECVGVLHHMADWRAGWRILVDRLKVGGLMYVGLYSAVSRSNLAALRTDPAYPGPGCSDSAARQFRRTLLMRDPGEPGSELKISRDFHNLNAFRDLVLHESEAHATTADIAAFLDANGLAFRGFTLDPRVISDFLAATPGSKVPGELAQWAVYEAQHPRTFDGMYRFWVERTR